MIVNLFDLEGGVVKPTVHCHTLKTLKDIMDNHKDYLKIYQYIYYMTCPSPDNVWFHIKDEDREEMIMKEIQGKFNIEDEDIVKALEFCRNLYETPSYRTYVGMSGMLDRVAEYVKTTKITSGRDGNLTAIMKAAKELPDVRKAFQQSFSEMLEEQKSVNRGKEEQAYDM